MTRPLPSGIVTFLFTDIEGSTRRLSAVGDAAWVALLARERELVIGAVGREGGVEFGTEGDAHFVAFESVAAGIRGAVAAQLALAAHHWDGEPLRVRMGLHTGEAVVVGDDYAGYEVHRAARVAAAGHGGQILVTDPVRVLAGAAIPGVVLRDLGVHQLKDLAKPEHLYQVEAEGLAASFPPLRTLDATPNNLPSQVTSFVGRREVETVRRLLDGTRLLTLTGPGGTGKTRLSLALASDCAERFPGGAWFVPLAAVTDPGLVASAIASALGVLTSGRPPLDAVIDLLRGRRSLLVLDNFEQVIDGAPVVAELLHAAPELTVIVSSRAPLRIAGEQEFLVPPLSLPEPDEADPARAMDAEAVRLFVERAAAVRHDLELTPANTRAVVEIVRRLDGLPLAIELAAARVRLLPPVAMARRLDDRLGLLAGAARDATARQGTLRGAIGWSWELLAPTDQVLFARLGVFAGGGELDLVDEVCALPGDAPPLDATAGVERLAEQSLVRIVEDGRGDVRFAMLETIREYALERLAAEGTADEVRRRHAAAYLALARRLGPDSDAPSARRERLDALEDAHDNLRAALDFLVATGDTVSASALAFACWRFWQMRGHVVEGRVRVDRVLAMPGWRSEDGVARLRALEAAGGLAYWTADLRAANAHYVAAEALARELGDEAELANALYNRAFASDADTRDGWMDAMRENRPFLDQAIAIWTRLGDDRGLARGYWGLSESHIYRGELEEAGRTISAALEIFERLGDPFWIAWARFTRSFGLTRAGRAGPAAADMAVALRLFDADQDVSGVALVLSLSSSLMLVAGRPRAAYELFAAATRLVATTGVHLAGLWPDDVFPAPDVDTPDPELRDALAAGSGWDREEAVREALLMLDEVAAAA